MPPADAGKGRQSSASTTIRATFWSLPVNVCPSNRQPAISAIPLTTRLVQPPFQPATILVQQERTYSVALANNPMRLRIARCARDPLLPHPILRRRKPLLRQHLNQPRMRIQDKERECRIVTRRRFVARRNNNLFDRGKLQRHVNLVSPPRQLDPQFKLRHGSRMRIDALTRLFEPSRQLGQLKSLQRVRIEASQPDASSLRTPDTQIGRRDEERPAIGIQRQPC